MRCPHCRATMDVGSITSLGSVSGEHGALKLGLEDVPARKCPAGHASPVDKDFMLWLLDELKERAQALPGGTEKGMVFKKHFCECGKELPSRDAGRRVYPAELSYDGKYAIKAAFDVPVYKCEGCGKEQVRSATGIRKDTSHAMVGITDKAGFPHAG